MIGGYNIRVLFRIFRLRRREEVNLAIAFEDEQKLRVSTRFGQEGVCEVLTAKHGGPEIAYATTSRYSLRRQPREYLVNEFIRNRERVLMKSGHRSRKAPIDGSTRDVLPPRFHGGDT
ncbi:Uncharacterized protein Rs2_17361 [Raphanus sativus]|nr:Uncharacterized protein Rs2_17361 [Raphanus sativus]